MQLLVLVSLVAAVTAAPCLTTTDLFTHKVEMTYATLANITYHGYYKIVDIVPKTGSPYKALLVQDGCDAPTDVANVDTTITVPVTAVAVTDTTTLPFVEQLGERPTIKAIGSGAQYITSNCIHYQLDVNDTIIAVDGWSFDTAAAKAAGVDAGATVTLAGASAFAAVTGAGMNMLPMQEPYEPLALGSAEWVKIVSALYNKENVGNKEFDDSKNLIDCGTTKEVDEFMDRPQILWFSSYAPGTSEACTVGACKSVGPYYCEFAEMTGAEIVNYTALNIIPDPSWNYGAHTVEQVNELCKSADYIFYTGDFDAMWKRLGNNETMKDCAPLVTKGKVYDTQAADAGGNALFERKIAEPDLLLGDFANIIGGELHEHLAVLPNALLRNVQKNAVAYNENLINPSCTTSDEAASALRRINRPCAKKEFEEFLLSSSSVVSSNMLAIVVIATLFLV